MLHRLSLLSPSGQEGRGVELGRFGMVCNKKKYSVVGVIGCLGIGVTGAQAQVAPPACQDCGNMPFVPLYAPRPIALIAKVRGGEDLADRLWSIKVNAADLSLLLGWWTSESLRLLLPADGDELNGRSVCMLQPGESCAAVGAELTLDTARAEECLRCAIGAFGYEQPDAFAAWLSTSNTETREIVCTCVSAMIRSMMEDDNHD